MSGVPLAASLVLARQRQAYILDRVREDGGVRVAELVRDLGVSDMTVRRDLELLAEQGLIGLSSIARLDQADLLITDSGLDPTAREILAGRIKEVAFVEPRLSASRQGPDDGGEVPVFNVDSVRSRVGVRPLQDRGVTIGDTAGRG